MPGTKRTGPASWKAAKRVKRTTSRRINTAPYLVAPVSRVEIKAISSFDTGTANATGASFSLGTVGMGDEYNQRTGRAIRHLKSELYIELTKPGSTQVVDVRIIYGIWKQSRDVTNPTSSEVLDLTLHSGVEYLAPFNPQFSSNMVILMDELHAVNSGSSSGSGGTATEVVARKSFQRKYDYKAIQEYTGLDNSDVGNWNHFCLVLSDTGNALFRVSAQHYFTDA